MRPFTLLFLVFLLGIRGAAPDPLRAGTNLAETIVIATVPRTYELYLPDGIGKTRPAPLVIVLHGINGNGFIMREFSGFNALADREKFIVCYPDAFLGAWNDGRNDQFSHAFRANIDDIAFIRGIIDSMVARRGADRSRIYVAGFSNGGMMAHRLAIQLSDHIAAIASVGATLPWHLSQAAPRRPVPVLMINGTDDTTVPWKGGVLVSSGQNRGTVLSVEATMAYWAGINRCGQPPKEEAVPYPATDDGITVTSTIYGDCAGSASVVLYAINGGGHVWPGPEYPLTLPVKTARHLKSADVSWRFFVRHRIE